MQIHVNHGPVLKEHGGHEITRCPWNSDIASGFNSSRYDVHSTVLISDTDSG